MSGRRKEAAKQEAAAALRQDWSEWKQYGVFPLPDEECFEILNAPKPWIGIMLSKFKCARYFRDMGNWRIPLYQWRILRRELPSLRYAMAMKGMARSLETEYLNEKSQYGETRPEAMLRHLTSLEQKRLMSDSLKGYPGKIQTLWKALFIEKVPFTSFIKHFIFSHAKRVAEFGEEAFFSEEQKFVIDHIFANFAKEIETAAETAKKGAKI